MSFKARRKSIHITLILVLILVITLFIVFLLFETRKYEIEILPITLSVGNHVGFDLNDTSLSLGTALPGSTPERSFTLVAPRDRHVTLLVRGIDFLSISQTDFDIQQGETITISVKALVPSSIAFGDYSGQLIILSKDI